MSAGEWIALGGLAITVVVASLATWRASLRRDGAIDERLANIAVKDAAQDQQIASLETSLRASIEAHAAEDATRERAMWRRIDEDRDKRHEVRNKMQTLYSELKEELAEMRGRMLR